MFSSDLKILTQLLRRALVFLLPIFVFMLLVVAIDPFDFFGLPSLVPTEVKSRYALLDQVLWKTIHFRRTPCKSILLGDSRMGLVDESKVLNVTGIRTFNFAYAGGTLPELIDTFWFAAKRTQLESVTIGINLNVYNDVQRIGSRFPSAQELLDHPYKYFFNTPNFRLAYYALKDHYLGQPTALGKPNMTREEFWAERMGPGAREYYARYAYPTRYAKDLQEISRYCKDHRIELRFIIMPNYVDFQRKIDEYGLHEANRIFHEDLGRLGPVLDLDQPNELTLDRGNYNDPNHLTPEAYDKFIKLAFPAGNSNTPSGVVGEAPSAHTSGG